MIQFHLQLANPTINYQGQLQTRRDSSWRRTFAVSPPLQSSSFHSISMQICANSTIQSPILFPSSCLDHALPNPSSIYDRWRPSLQNGFTINSRDPILDC